MVFNAYHTASNRYYDGTEFKYGPLSDDYKQALQYLNKIYTEGLISPDYFTYTTDMGNADLESGTACKTAEVGFQRLCGRPARHTGADGI